MRPEYDFSGAARGVTAARYTKEQTSWSWIQRFLMFSPIGVAVSEALRALAPILRRRQSSRKRKKVA